MKRMMRQYLQPVIEDTLIHGCEDYEQNLISFEIVNKLPEPPAFDADQYGTVADIQWAV